jgi:hypothetical protein
MIKVAKTKNPSKYLARKYVKMAGGVEKIMLRRLFGTQVKRYTDAFKWFNI